MIALLSKLLQLSIAHRWAVVVLALATAALGAYNFTRLPIDAVPDITNVQVQVATSAPALAPFEVEQQITYPLESALGGIPAVEQVRSLSRPGLSVITVVFEDGTDIYWARQQIAERVLAARELLPNDADPELGPIATGLGEIYLWTVEADEGARRADGLAYTLADLREVQDWIIRPQIRNVRGITEVNSMGGHERVLLVAPDPRRLIAHGVSFRDIVEALRRNNLAAGGGVIEERGEQILVRAGGLVANENDVRSMVVHGRSGTPVRLGDLGEVSMSVDTRTGAATFGGNEVVLGTAIMLMGENSRTVATRVRERLDEVRRSLPPGVRVRTVYDRTYLVDATLHTVTWSLLEGAALVVVVLLLLLGNVRAALVTAVAIPFAMSLAVTGMAALGVSGNLMSLGAIDFGLIVDGAVVVVENSVRRLGEEQRTLGRALAPAERLRLAYEASREVLQATVFGQLIIAVVYIPVLSLTGIEGKMFRPMAVTVVLALAAAMVLSMTLVPALVAIVLTGKAGEHENAVSRATRRGYDAVLGWALAHRAWVLAGAVLTLGATAGLATTLGSEFVPTLSEGAFALELRRLPSISMTESVAMEQRLERVLLERFPDEVDMSFGRIGTAEVATDPMGPDSTDVFIMLKPRDEWTRAGTQDELAEVIQKELENVPGQSFEFSQPIEMRFNELISGVRSDVAVKVFGDDLDVLLDQARSIARVLAMVRGAESLRVEQVGGLPVLAVEPDRAALARHGLAVEDVHDVVRTAIGGTPSGFFLEGDRRFPIVVRLAEPLRRDPRALGNLPVLLPAVDGGRPSVLPLSDVARIVREEGPYQVNREDGKRRIVVQCNVGGRDLGSFVAEAQKKVATEVPPAPGTWIAWGGQFENLVAARERLMLVVPLALGLILALLYAAFGSVRNVLLIFTAVPLALTGGVVALVVRGLPFSISAAVGFIALSGVAVLNGLVMVSFIEGLRREGAELDDAVHRGSLARLRPVLMTALVAALGFVPMALATGTGAEVQRPLATVVIGGILSSTLLTLLVLPVLHRMVHGGERRDVAAPRTETPAGDL